MSDELSVNPEPEEINLAAEEFAAEESAEASPEDDFEEISSDEVDRVVAVIDDLIETVQSENIQSLLEDASNSIFSLVYDDEDLEDVHDEAA